MTLHKLSAGTGYEYLTRQVAAVDSTDLGRTKLADYYSAKGEAPGRWTGSGLAGVDGIEARDVVTAEKMKHLFGTGSHPVTGTPLDRAFRVYGTEGVDGFNAEVARRIDSLEDPTPADRAQIRSKVATDGVAHDDQRLLGPRVDDPGGHSYARRLQRQIDECYPQAVRRWEARVVEVVGRHDEQTLQLASELDRL